MTDHDAYLTTANGIDRLYRAARDDGVTMNRLQITIGPEWAVSIEATDDGTLEATRV